MQRACELATGESYDPSSGRRFRAGRGTKMFEMFEGMGFAIEMVSQEQSVRWEQRSSNLESS